MLRLTAFLERDIFNVQERERDEHLQSMSWGHGVKAYVSITVKGSTKVTIFFN